MDLYQAEIQEVEVEDQEEVLRPETMVRLQLVQPQLLVEGREETEVPPLEIAEVRQQ